jgi:hypothetical protein
MRLTIAATLLTQAIPVASSSQSKNVAPFQNKNMKMRRLQARKQRRLDKALAIQRSVLLEDPTIENKRILKNSKKIECDPYLELLDREEELLDVGILSCAAGLHCEESGKSPLGGFCDMENSKKVECDPFLDMLDPELPDLEFPDPDPEFPDPELLDDMLSCGAGLYCEESDKSPLGGFCGMENSKKLECDPIPELLDPEFLDDGILSCGSPDLYSCEESQESALGGFCYDIEAIEEAKDNYDDYSGSLCDPTDPDYDAAMNCNCDDLDTMMTGIVHCLPQGDGCFAACVESAGVLNSFCT